MARLPYAAKTLIAQAQDHNAKAKAEPTDDPDGLNVHRTIKFDKRTSKWLAPLLDEVRDSRLVEWGVTEAGYLHVTFTPGPDADRADEFPLDAAAEVTQAG